MSKKPREITLNGTSFIEKTDSKGGGCIGVLVIIIALIVFGVQQVTPIFNNMIGNRTGYITTLVELYEYKSIEKIPLDKNIGKIESNTVCKLKKVEKRGDLTWVCVYKLENDTPKMTYILLPEKLKDIEDQNKYVKYNENSKTWNDYYLRIDEANNKILNDISKLFLEDIKAIEVKNTSDNIVKESIKDSVVFLKKDGYLGLFVSKDATTYYIDKKDKEIFLKAYDKYNEEYKSKRIEYY